MVVRRSESVGDARGVKDCEAVAVEDRETVTVSVTFVVLDNELVTEDELVLVSGLVIDIV